MRWILFDIGGVLENVDDAAWPEQMRARIASYAVLTPDEAARRIRAANLPRTDITTGTEDIYWRMLGDALGLDEATRDRARSEFWDAYCGTANTELVEYARSLRGRVRLAILSNSGDGAREEEERRFGFSQIFDPICYSHEQGVNKPEALAFEKALEQMGTAADRVLFIDDVAANIEGAAACGIRGHLHTRNKTTIEAIEAFLAR